MAERLAIVPKGTRVLIKTTNGGELTTTLVEDYRPTYDLVIGDGEHTVLIGRERIKSVDPIE